MRRDRPQDWLVGVAGAAALAVIAVALIWFTDPGGDSPSSRPDAEARPTSQPGEPDGLDEEVRAISPPEADVGLTSPSPSASTTSPSPDGGPRPTSLVGDHRTADPCALTNESALARFGYTDLDNDYGNFDRCDLLVSPEDGLWVDVEVSFTMHSHIAGELREPVPARTVGEIGIAEALDEPGDCDRALLLPGEGDSGTVVWISASTDDGSAPLCDMADAAATSAAQQLDSLVESGDRIPRRSPPPAFPDESLIWQDACSLLDADALSTVPGINAAEPYTYFGAWQCDWTSQNGETSVGLIYDRGYAMTQDDATPVRIGDRRGFFRPEADGPDTCTAWVEQRDYIDEYGETAVESVRIWVAGEGRSEARLCDWATALATSAAGQLPPT